MPNQKANINIEEYIEAYENRDLTVADIARIERLCIATVNRHLNEYYYNKREERPVFRKRKERLDISIYIPEYELGNITIDDIANMTHKSKGFIYGLMKEYYEEKGERKVPRIGINSELIISLIKRGISKEQIIMNARKRGVIITDANYEEAVKKMNEKFIEKE